MKKVDLFVIAVRWAFIVAGLLLVATPFDWLPEYYKPIPMGIAAIGYSFLIALPEVVFRKASLHTKKIFTVVLAGNLLLTGMGSLGLWNTSIAGLIPYDKLVHFLFSGTMLASGTLLFAFHYGWPIKKTALILAAIIAVFGVVWEFVEYFFAAHFHIGYFGTLFDHDSRFDVVTNISGITVGLIILAFFRHKRST